MKKKQRFYTIFKDHTQLIQREQQMTGSTAMKDVSHSHDRTEERQGRGLRYAHLGFHQEYASHSQKQFAPRVRRRSSINIGDRELPHPEWLRICTKIKSDAFRFWKNFELKRIWFRCTEWNLSVIQIKLKST